MAAAQAVLCEGAVQGGQAVLREGAVQGGKAGEQSEAASAWCVCVLVCVCVCSGVCAGGGIGEAGLVLTCVRQAQSASP